MKKYVGILASALLILALASCGGEKKPTETEAPSSTDTTVEATEPSTSGATDPDTSATEAPTEAVTEPETETETEKETSSIVYSELNDLQKMTTPFWKMDTMHREATCMIVRDDGAITAKLAFKPLRIISVESNDLKTVYELDKDYTWDGESNVIVWKEGSAIPYFTQNDIQGKREDGSDLDLYPVWDDLGRSRFGNQLYCVSAFLYEKQIAVTYEYEYGSWEGEVTPYQGDKLPKTMAKLRAGETINLFYFGDSIFTGCDSSAMYNREPFQNSFPEFTKQVLEAKFGGRVKLYNPSVGGMQSDWGVKNIDKLVCDRADPDLVIIGFGMNDQFGGRVSANNVKTMMETVRARFPDCEFVVVACMVPNAEAGFLTNQASQPVAYKKLVGETEGCAFVNMFNCHKKLLENKDFISMSGNNINHPNDFLIRVYAQQILSVFLEY